MLYFSYGRVWNYPNGQPIGEETMTNETVKAAVASAYGETIPEIKFSFVFEKYDSAEEVRSKYTPNELSELILGGANAANKANARAKATTAALDAAGHKKPDPNSDEVLEANMVKNLMKRKGLDEATAKQIVAGLIGA